MSVPSPPVFIQTTKLLRSFYGHFIRSAFREQRSDEDKDEKHLHYLPRSEYVNVPNFENKVNALVYFSFVFFFFFVLMKYFLE